MKQKNNNMQTSHLKLREIIWEITGECNNGCTYCGSKTIRNIKNSNESILKIAKAIAQYPPEEINISGGDPFLVEPDIHQELVSLFRANNIVCKLIASPNSLITNDGEINRNAFDIIQLYDWIGISINNKKELEKFRKYKEEFKFKNFTIITNFNIQNLYDFDLIETFAKGQDCLWTIQFTVCDESSPLALYSAENEEAFNHLKEKYYSSTAKIILSDNIRADVGCGAGRSSIGITYNGAVIPCLSMRSWTNPLLEKDLYFITETPLQEIWMNGFKQQRFGCFECCKDACNNKFLENKKVIPLKKIEIPFEDFEEKKGKDWKKILEEISKKQKQDTPAPYPKIEPQVVMYGVVSPRDTITLVYGVPSPIDCNENVYIYDVIDNSKSEIKYTNENLSDESEKTSGESEDCKK